MGNLDQNVHFELSSISVEFVYTQLCAVNTKKSSGMPDIPSRLIKDGAPGLAEPLLLLMNRTINEGTLPTDWKHTVVTPVHKAGTKGGFPVLARSSSQFAASPLRKFPIGIENSYRN
jgi:hypothetical protein